MWRSCLKISFDRLKRGLLAFYRFNSYEKHIFYQSFFLLPLVSYSLRFFGYKKVYRNIRNNILNAKRSSDINDNIYDQIELVIDVFNRVVWGIYPKLTCLPKSLTLWWILNRNGLEADFFIGVKKKPRAIQGHAWVEFEGKILNDNEHFVNEYTVIDGSDTLDYIFE